MIEQLTFREPPAEDADREQLRTILAQQGEWRTAEFLGGSLGWRDRRVRLVAASCDDVISFPGSPGYKLLAHCTVAEFQRFKDASRSQAKKMIGRTIRAEKLYHAMGHAA